MLPNSTVGAKLAAKKGSKETKKEHNFRCDKKNHTITHS